MKKLIAIAVAAACGVGALGLATSADARVRVVVSPYYRSSPWDYPVFAPVKPARYIACRKKVLPQRGYGAAALFAVDYCYAGLPW
jgi:hypothetical protein